MNNSKKTVTRFRLQWSIAVATILNMCFVSSMDAQQWQYVYGSTGSMEFGYSGVTPVTGACSAPPSCLSCTPNGDGYISVGSAFEAGGSDNDVYIVRTDNNGAMIWEKTYDINGNNSTDEGRSIIELSDGSGFVAVGVTQTQTTTSTFLLKVDCDGRPVWTQTYTGQYGTYGTSLIEATTGDQIYGTSAGDIVVSGIVLTLGSSDALLFRTDALGGLIWDAAYSTGAGIADEFRDLTEATAVNGQRTGDIIGVGLAHDIQTPGPNVEGLVIRVDGNNGNITGGVQGAATYGVSTYDDFFFSVIELQNPSETGILGYPNVVIAGISNDHGTWGADNYFVKLEDGNPCNPLVQTTVGDRTPSLIIAEAAYDIKEITAPITSSGGGGGGTGGGGADLAQWDLVVTGEVTGSTPQRDAYLLGLSSATLTPLANIGQRYHPTGTDRGEFGRSLAIVDDVGGRTEGVVMCGSTFTDWLLNTDPGDMYLLKTDIALSTNTNCESAYSPGYTSQDRFRCITPTIEEYLDDTPENSTDTDRNWGDVVCTNSGNSGKRVISFDNERTSPELSYTVRTSQNPITSGEPLTFYFEGTDLPEAAEIQIANSLGKIIWTSPKATIASDGSLSVHTNKWESGIYFATIVDRSYRRMIRVVVVE